MSPSPEVVQRHILSMVSEPLAAIGLTASDVPADFDLMREGVIDSFGIMEMISSLEERFSIDIDLDGLEVVDLTVIGPLSTFVAQQIESGSQQS